jgi:ketosteroid isomerase-like protein
MTCESGAVSDLDDFLAQTVERHSTAVTAVRNGDAARMAEMLSAQDPVTLFPAAKPTKSGFGEVSEAFRRVASAYSGSAPVAFDVVAAGVGGDLAYLVGYERGSSSIGNGPAQTVSLRVTQVYRRKNGEWKLVHRHADAAPGGESGVDHLRSAMPIRRPIHRTAGRAHNPGGRGVKDPARALDVIPEHVVHPGPLGGWGCSTPTSSKEDHPG